MKVEDIATLVASPTNGLLYASSERWNDATYAFAHDRRGEFCRLTGGQVDALASAGVPVNLTPGENLTVADWT